MKCRYYHRKTHHIPRRPEERVIMEIIRQKECAMAVEVTLQLPEHLVEHAKRFGEATQREVVQVLADTLEMRWAPMGMGPALEPPV